MHHSFLRADYYAGAGGGYFISGNHDPDVGSVLYIVSTGNLTLNNTTVTNGTGHLFSRFIRGGGIYNSGILTLTNSTVSGNYAYHDYGECCNDPISHGGGIYNSGTAMLTNSTISGNSTHCYHYYDGYGSSRGGGIYNSGILTLINSTVSSNYAFASGKGGGIYNDGTVTLYSSLISGNTTDGMMGSGNEVNSTGGIIADSFNLFGHSGETSAEAFNFSPGSNDVTATSDGTKPTALSDILASLADNDGPTKTHALVQDSPAIDLDAICSTSPDTDQRGYPRPERGYRL